MEDFNLNQKRVYKLRREEGLKIPNKQRKKRGYLSGTSEKGYTRRRWAEH